MNRKMRVLIAEDEIAIAGLIKELIDFEGLNLDLAGIAYNGIEALNMMQESAPEIVITDISMPLMSGLELIEKAQEQNFKTQFIIISGLTQFQYALSAIKMGVAAYLLKPINKAELNDVLEKTILQIASNLQIDYRIRELTRNSHVHKEKLRRSFLQEILYNKDLPPLSFADVNEEYGFSFQDNSDYIFGIVWIDGISALSLPTQNSVIEQLMRSFQTEIQKRCIDNEVFNRNNHFVFLTDYLPDEAGSVLASLSNVHADMCRFICSYEGLSVTLCCGLSVSSIQSLRSSMESAYKALPARILLGSSQIIRAEKLFRSEAPVSVPLPESSIVSIAAAVQKGDEELASSLLSQAFREVVKASEGCPHMLTGNLQNAVSALLSAFGQTGLISGNITDLYMKYCDGMEPYFTVDSLISYSVSSITSLFPFHDAAAAENKIITIARAYIQEHLDSNLKLEDVAEQVYLAPSYFGVLFKKETGESFTSYLTGVRIEKAKEYLQDIRLNISEVASAVGYQDKRYFSKLFKEQVGLTPKEYRKIYAR